MLAARVAVVLQIRSAEFVLVIVDRTPIVLTPLSHAERPPCNGRDAGNGWIRISGELVPLIAGQGDNIAVHLRYANVDYFASSAPLVVIQRTAVGEI